MCRPETDGWKHGQSKAILDGMMLLPRYNGYGERNAFLLYHSGCMAIRSRAVPCLVRCIFIQWLPTYLNNTFLVLENC